MVNPMDLPVAGVRHHRAPVGPWLPWGCPCPPGWDLDNDTWVVPPETRYQRRIREMSEAEYLAEQIRLADLQRVEDWMRTRVKVGDRIQRRRCGGVLSTFTFVGWDGSWMCGRTVWDCHPAHVVRINRVDVDHGIGES